MKKQFYIFTLFVTLGLSINSFAQATKTKTDVSSLRVQLKTQIDDWHKNAKFPGATIGICLADGNCFGLATGFSDRDAKVAMKPDDFMAAGSVGKTYAAALTMQLMKEGKIDLDDQIEKYLGREKWFSHLPNAKDITVRQLMTHTSGLVRYEFKDTFTKDLTANPDKVWKPEELVAYILDTKAPFEAGKGWDYSDTNYIVLGMIIEKVTGKKYYELVKTNLDLNPLKLKHTKPQDRREIKGLIQGYAGENNPFGGTDAMIKNGKFAVNPQFEWTGGGMVTSAEDLARWAKFMYEGKAFSAELLPKMLDGVSAPQLGKETKYGLGVIIYQTPKGPAYGHSGFFPGYITNMLYFPEHKISVAVQVNTSVSQSLGRNPAGVLIELADVITNATDVSSQKKSDEENALEVWKKKIDWQQKREPADYQKFISRFIDKFNSDDLSKVLELASEPFLKEISPEKFTGFLKFFNDENGKIKSMRFKYFDKRNQRQNAEELAVYNLEFENGSQWDFRVGIDKKLFITKLIITDNNYNEDLPLVKSRTKLSLPFEKGEEWYVLWGGETQDENYHVVSTVSEKCD